MSEERQKKQVLLQVAKKEFLEKGFMKASLRTICKEAGMTTGALYFFFKDKDDLFGALVRDVLNEIILIAQRHFAKEAEEIKEITFFSGDYRHETIDSIKIAHIIFDHYDEMYLLIEKAQGSSYANAIGQFIEMIEKHNRVLADGYCQAMGRELLSDELIHWVSHSQISMFVYIVEHRIPKEKAEPLMEQMSTYLVEGFFGLFKTEQ